MRRLSIALITVMLAGCVTAGAASGPGPDITLTRPAASTPPTPVGVSTPTTPATFDMAAALASLPSTDTVPGPADPQTGDTVAVPPRRVFTHLGVPFARAGDVILVVPSPRLEIIGFHESNHEGARQMEPLPDSAPWFTMESRGRGNGSRTAADVVVQPGVPIRSPVTGTVKSAGTYVLYCRYSDDFAYIAPDARPAWRVKILHIDHVSVRPGDRVVAGETIIARGPTPLPFRSQVDDATSAPSWNHIHIEVIDPSIPNIPSPGGGC